MGISNLRPPRNSKNAPESPEGIERMAAEFRERKAREKAEREKTEQERLLELLQTADRNAAERAAREFLGGSV